MGDILSLQGLTGIDWLKAAGLFLLKPLLILIVCKIVISILLKIANALFEKTNLAEGIKGFAKSAIKIVLWVLTIIFIAESLGVNTASLVTVLGVASLAFSLSLQNIITNVFAGIAILMTKPFVVGDYVEVAGISGVVKEIKLMRTTIMTLDNKVQLVPNSEIDSSKIINYSKEPLRRVDFTVSVSYDAPTAAVKKAVMEVVDKDDRVLKDEEHAPFVRLSEYNANDITYTVRLWTENANYWGVYFDTLEEVRESFARNNIQFSYPHVVVHNEK